MFAQLLFSGLALGSMYALVALGYNITYATSKTVNFAQGQSVMVGAVVAYALYVGAGWPFVPSVLATLLALAALGVLVERVAAGHDRPRGHRRERRDAHLRQGRPRVPVEPRPARRHGARRGRVPARAARARRRRGADGPRG